VDLYEWTIARGDAPACAAIQRRLVDEDPGAVIGQAAIDQTDAGCVLAVDRFLSLYGAEAGNLALKVIPRGGLFIAGGIAPRLRPLFARPDFLDGFLAKGRMRPLLATIQIELVLDPRVGLYGARAAALLDASP